MDGDVAKYIFVIILIGGVVGDCVHESRLFKNTYAGVHIIEPR